MSPLVLIGEIIWGFVIAAVITGILTFILDYRRASK